MSKLSELTKKNYALIYRSLIKQIESREGYGFHNNDQGHSILVQKMDDINDGERYKANYSMFELVSALAEHLKKNDDDFFHSNDLIDLSDWDTFRNFSKIPK